MVLGSSTATPTTGTMPTNGLAEGYVGLTVTLNSSSTVTASSSFQIDLTTPTAPTVTSGTVTTSTPVVSGTTAADTDVLKVTLNNVTYTAGDGYLTYVKGSTTWSLSVPAVNALASGTYSVTAVAYDLAGNNATDVTSSELAVSLNTAAPVVDLNPANSGTLNNSATYTQGGASVAFALSGTSISDSDSTSLASLTISFVTSSAESGDRFEVGSTNIYLSSASASGTVYFNNTYFNYSISTIGSNKYLQFTSRDGTNSSNAVALVASYESLIDAIKFSNDAVSFTNGSTRTFSVTANDGSQSSQQAATFTVSMVSANTPPTLAAVTAGSVADATNSSSLGTTSGLYGTLVGADADAGNTLTYGISGSSVASYTSSASGSSVTYNLSIAGTYGTLYVASATGKYLYVADATLVNAIPLGTNPTENFTMSVTDGTATTTQNYSVNITGANEAPTLATVTSGSVADAVNSSALGSTSSLFGTLSGADTDTGTTLTYGMNGSAVANYTSSDSGTAVTYDLSVAGTYGTLYIQSTTGKYLYVATASLVDALSAGVVAAENFTVSVSDGTATTTQAYAINLTGANEAPVGTDKTISINEDATYTFSASDFGFTDVDTGDTLRAVRIDTLPTVGSLKLLGVAITQGQIVLVADIGNLIFTPAANANGTAYSSFTFTVQDSGGSTFASTSKTITVNVVAVNDAPVASGTATLASIAEDTASPTGASVLSLFGGGSNFSDATDTVTGGSSANTFAGIAISSYTADATKGTWEYQVAGTGSWITLGNGTTTAAITLNASDMLRFVPAANYSGTSTSLSANLVESGLTLTSGSAIDLTGATGGTTHISSGTVTLSETITAVNDTPTRTAGTLTAVSVNEDSANSTAVSLGLTGLTYGPGGGADETSQTLTYTITGIPSFITLYKADGTTQVTATMTLSASELAGLKYKTVADGNGTGSITWTVTDNGTTNGSADPKTLTETLSVTVAAVNDAPVLDATQSPALTSILEDAAAPSASVGTLVSALVGGVSDPDGAGVSKGIAITATNNTNGTIYYSTNGGTSWIDVGTVSDASALLLASDANTRLYFKPNANYNGSISDLLTIRAWDQTSGTAGTKVSTSSNGGTTAFSAVTDTVAITVTSVNDAPSGTSTSVTTLEDTAYTFTTANFGFSDTSDSPANNLSSVKITTIPGAGTLKLNGVTVNAGDYITATDITAGKLVFTPAANSNGTGYASFTFQVKDDGGTASSGVDLDPAAKTMTINVTSVNDAPSGANKTVATMQNEAYTFAVSDFGFTDTTDNPSANSLLAVKISTLPSAGSLTLNGVAVTLGTFVTATDIQSGKLVFTPASNANGTGYASFTFQVQDNGGTANSGVNLDPSAKTMTLDVKQTPTLSVSSVSVSELSPYANFTVSLSSASLHNIQFTPSLVSGTATVGVDTASTLQYFDGTNWVSASTITIPAGQLSISLRLAIVQDSVAESTEILTVKTGSLTYVVNTSGAEGVISITDPVSPQDPVITDVLETANDPTPFDLLTAQTLQVVKVTGQIHSDFVDLFLKNTDCTYTQVNRALYTTTENPTSAGQYTLNFGANALSAGEYVARTTLSGSNSRYSNSFTIDSTPGLYDITGLRQNVTVGSTQTTQGGVGGMDQNRNPTYWNGTNWLDADGQVISFTFISSTANPTNSSETKTLADGSTLTMNTRTGTYTYTPSASAVQDTFIIYATDGNKGANLSLTFNAKDTLDRDGIPSTVETNLANLVSGGTAGDLNGDGIADQNQNAVTTLAWTTVDKFQAGMDGTLTSTTPVISLIVMQSSSGSTVDATAQLTDVKVLSATDTGVGGSKPADASWDPIQFSIEPLQSMGLLDADTTRAGTQMRIDIDISRSGIKSGEFTKYMKYVSATTIADYTAIGVTLVDLDGNNVTQAGWYDYTQRTAGGDGARFIVSGGLITTIEIIVTDNKFGDNNATIGKVFDPGVPIYNRPQSQSGGNSDPAPSSSSPTKNSPATTSVVTPTTTTSVAPTSDANQLASIASRAGHPLAQNLDAILVSDKPFDSELDEVLKKDKVIPTVMAGRDQYNKVTSIMAPPPIRMADTVMTKVPGDYSVDAKAKATENASALKNTLTPPDALASPAGKIDYQLPQGTFSGGKGAINLMATMKDGSPLPSWVTFDGATGKMSATVPASVKQPIEIKIQATDTNGSKAETQLKINPAPEKRGFVGKKSLAAQIDQAIRLRA